ncbi:MAG: sulfur oxidation c-type cytochrome SoxA [Hyphomicrobiales bacterium]
MSRSEGERNGKKSFLNRHCRGRHCCRRGNCAGAIANAQDLPAGIDTIKVKPASSDHPFDEIVSGWDFRSPETQQFQKDDFDNSAFLWVEKGEELWSEADGEAGKSCQSCHDDAAETMKGVGAASPKWNEKLSKPLALEQRINLCRTENMKAKEWKWESENMLSMTSYVRNQSRGMPVKVQSDGPMKPWWEKGKELYYTRVGQLNMACANCHEDNYGKYIRADHLSQGHSNGFPTYRLKWQKLGSLHRRFSGCMKNIRAVPYKRGSEEFVALEIYLAWRGEGLPVESPAVRQ